jgi:hypothetical protein
MPHLYDLPAFYNAYPTGMLFNAKDVRTLDSTYACMERWLVLAAGNTTSNFYSAVGSPRAWFYRSEADNIQSLKSFILNECLGDFYYISSASPLVITAFNESNLCAVANVPTNFLRYTPYRAADGSWRHYGRIYTNTYYLATTGIYELVTSAGTEVAYTNATTNATVTLYSTNTSIQAGYAAVDYGWDGLRRVITNLHTTLGNSQWWAGTKYTNHWGYSTNYSNPFTNLVNPVVSGTDGAPYDLAQARLDATAQNGWSDQYYPYSPDSGSWSYDWSAHTNVGAEFSITNTAPFKTAWGYNKGRAYFWTEYAINTTFGNQIGTNWGLSENVFYHYAAQTAVWDFVEAPVRSYYSNAPAPRTVDVYLSTNSTVFHFDSVVLSKTDADAVTSNYVPVLPVSNLVSDIEWGSGYGEGGGGGESGVAYVDWSMYATTNGFTNYESGEVVVNLIQNADAVSIHKVLNRWDFEYK